MKIQKTLCIIFAMLLLACSLFAQTQALWRVDHFGNITKDGNIFRIRGVSWTGLEGREVPNDDPTPTGGMPFMEMYMGNMFWAPSGRSYEQDIDEFKALGFNVIRLTIAPQTLDPDDMDGREPFLKNHASVVIENARLALETIITKLDNAGIYVLLNLYSCSNHVGWRAGRLDARPPYPDANLNHYDYMREDCSCTSDPVQGVTNINLYNEEKWLNDLSVLAGLGVSLGVSNIMGIDIFNEPWDYTWEEWRSMIDRAYQAINAVNPNILIFAEGISATAGKQDGTADTFIQVPHGSEAAVPDRGENLFEAGFNPPLIPKDRLVFSPHAFGPSVFVQQMFMDPSQPECLGLKGDEAGDNQCNIIINPVLLEQGWEEHFGYLKDLGYAVVIGAFGGNPDWPDNAPLRDQDRYSYLTDRTVDWQWQNAFGNYLIKKGICDSFYWAINPESIYTGGIYRHAYDPVSNIAGWGTWLGVDERKLDLLSLQWCYMPSDPPPTPVPSVGDVNGNGSIDIIDALLISQYYVGIELVIFITENADVNCDGKISIIDALLVAQYYVGLLGYFLC